MPAYQNIKAKRRGKKLSQDDVAERLRSYWPNITKGMVSKTESNQRAIPIDEGPLWAAALGCSVNDLVDPLPDPPQPVDVAGRRKPPVRRKK